jgi:hypothetical protein
MPYWMDMRVPDDILEDAYDKFGVPVDTRKDLQCDEGCHTKVRAYVETSNGGRMATFVCEKCGENLVESNGNWVSQDGWDEEDWDAARDWDEIRDRFKTAVEQEEKRRKRLIREYCNERVERRRNSFSLPADNASGEVWHDLLTSLNDEKLKREAYNAYLNSEWWRKRRQRVLDAKGETCRLQYPGCTGRATQIHHKTYEMIGFEPLHHLEPACKNCHDRLHEVRDGKQIA